jgi:hypothetical protein
MGTNSYLSSIWIILETSWTLRGIMKKSHNRSRFCRLVRNQSIRVVNPVVDKKELTKNTILPYRRRNSLEAQVLEQITEITADRFQVPYGYR